MTIIVRENSLYQNLGILSLKLILHLINIQSKTACQICLYISAINTTILLQFQFLFPFLAINIALSLSLPPGNIRHWDNRETDFRLNNIYV